MGSGVGGKRTGGSGAGYAWNGQPMSSLPTTPSGSPIVPSNYGVQTPVHTIWSSGGSQNPFSGAQNPFGGIPGMGGSGGGDMRFPGSGGTGGGSTSGGGSGIGGGGFDIKNIFNAPPDPRLEEFNSFLKSRNTANQAQETFDPNRVNMYAGMMNSPVQQAAAAQKAKSAANAALGTGGGGGGGSTSAGDKRVDANAARTMSGNYNLAVKGEQDRIYDAWKNNNQFALGMLPSYTAMGDDERARIGLGLQARGQDISQMLGEGQLSLGSQNLANSQMMALIQLMRSGGGGGYSGGYSGGGYY